MLIWLYLEFMFAIAEDWKTWIIVCIFVMFIILKLNINFFIAIDH